MNIDCKNLKACFSSIIFVTKFLAILLLKERPWNFIIGIHTEQIRINPNLLCDPTHSSYSNNMSGQLLDGLPLNNVHMFVFPPGCTEIYLVTP